MPLFGPSQSAMPGAYIPESSHELDFQMLKIDKTIFSNPKIAKILTDDSVRSYLSEQWTLALYYLASAYVGLVNASQGEYEGAFDNAAEIVLADILFLVNIARSRKGINISTIKGRGINRDLFEEPEQRPIFGNPLPKPEAQPPMNEQYYTEDMWRYR